MMGTGRSGTSVLSEAISIHEDLAWISNYLNIFPDFPVLSVCNRLTGIPGVGVYLRGKKKQKKGILSSLRRYLPYSAESYPVWEFCLGEKFSKAYLVGEKATPAEIQRTTAYFQKILKYHGRKVLFAKYTGPPRMAFLSSIFPGAGFIHVIRDPRAVVSSLLKVGFWREGGGLVKPWWQGGLTQKDHEDWERCGKTPAALAAGQWRRIIELADEESRLLDGKYFEIRYEDFMEDPQKMLSETFRCFGLSDDRRAHQYLDQAGKMRNVADKYIKYLSRPEIGVIQEITHDVAQRKGYIF